MSRTKSSRRIFPLQAVTKRLKSLLGEAEAKQFWVRAQFVPGNAQRSPDGHCYGALVETSSRGAVLARMKAIIWADDRGRIQEKLRKAGQEKALAGNQEICALCRIRFHAVYGLSLEIADVDVEFGESHLDRNRREILEHLQAEGLLELNRRWPLPRVPLRLGLITAKGSAAYEDFIKTLLASGFAFQVHLAAASMQGDGMLHAVLHALDALEQRELDVLCIVRGGGSPIDLACFDNQVLAERIARYHRPVWVGIGHEIDVTVPDFVAHSTFKTPTAVAVALVQHVQSLLDNLGQAEQQLKDLSKRQLQDAQHDLDQNDNGLRQGTRKFLELKDERFGSRARRLRDVVRQHQTDQANELERFQQRLQDAARLNVQDRRQALDKGASQLARDASTALAVADRDIQHKIQRIRRAPQVLEQRARGLAHQQQRLSDLDPQRILERGYSVTRDLEGRIIKDASQVNRGESLVTQLAQGQLVSIVSEENSDAAATATAVVRGQRDTTERDSGAAGPIPNSDGSIGIGRGGSRQAAEVDAHDAASRPEGD